VNSCFDLLNWGTVGDGHRPIFDSEMIGHVTLPPFPFFFMSKRKPTKCSVKCLNGVCVWFYEF